MIQNAEPKTDAVCKYISNEMRAYMAFEAALALICMAKAFLNRRHTMNNSGLRGEGVQVQQIMQLLWSVNEGLHGVKQGHVHQGCTFTEGKGWDCGEGADCTARELAQALSSMDFIK